MSSPYFTFQCIFAVSYDWVKHYIYSTNCCLTEKTPFLYRYFKVLGQKISCKPICIYISFFLPLVCLSLPIPSRFISLSIISLSLSPSPFCLFQSLFIYVSIYLSLCRFTAVSLPLGFFAAVSVSLPLILWLSLAFPIPVHLPLSVIYIAKSTIIYYIDIHYEMKYNCTVSQLIISYPSILAAKCSYINHSTRTAEQRESEAIRLFALSSKNLQARKFVSLSKICLLMPLWFFSKFSSQHFWVTKYNFFLL